MKIVKLSFIPLISMHGVRGAVALNCNIKALSAQPEAWFGMLICPELVFWVFADGNWKFKV